MPNDNTPLPQRVFMTLGSIVLIVAILSLAQKVLMPLALAMLLAFILTPSVAWLQRHRFPRVAAVTFTVALAAVVISTVAWIVTVQIRELADELPEHTQNIVNKIHGLKGISSGSDKFSVMVAEITKQIKDVNPGATIGDEEKPLPVIVHNEKPVFLSIFPAVAGTVGEFFASGFMVVMLTIFMLIRREDLRFRLIQLVGHGRLPLTTRALDEAGDRISAFLVMQLTVNTVFGFCFFVLLWILGVPYPFLWGFLSLVLRFIPYIGTWASLVLPLTLSIAISPDWIRPIEVFGLFLVLELLTANVLEPLLFSHSTGISAVALLLAAAFWTWLWGPLGLLLSTPLTVCLIVLGRYVPALRFFDVLLGAEPTMELDARLYQRLLAQDEEEATELVDEFLQKGKRADLFDDVMVPALVRMKRDAEHGDLEPGDKEAICRITRDILEDIAEPVPESEGKKVLLIGCPARDEVDELALEMFKQSLESSSCQVDVLSSDKLAAEMMGQVREMKPAVVCIAAVPPGGLAHARYLCKRLRSEMPDLKIVVGRWGQDASEKLDQRLRAAGADQVCTTLRDSRAYAQPLLQINAAPPPSRRSLQGASS